jgi:hypothetical protein
MHAALPLSGWMMLLKMMFAATLAGATCQNYL